MESSLPKNEETSRKLASVQIIDSIHPHTNSDNLALATVLGWQIVIMKNEFKQGDKVVYFEIDSKLPEDAPWCEFLRKKKFCVKTIKIRDRISQGLILPLTILGNTINYDDYSIGQDLTEILNVIKYEIDSDIIPPSKIGAGNNMPYPTYLNLPKTDEPRIQSNPELLEYFKNKPYYASIKYDGTSASYMFDIANPIKDPEDPDKIISYNFLVCSRNYILNPEEGGVYYKAAEIYDIKKKLEKLNYNIAIQCEIYGPKLQKNPSNATKLTIAVFNVFDLKEKRFFDLDELEKFCNDYKLPMVELIEKGESFNYTMEELKEKSVGYYPGTKNQREGLVFRAQKNFYNIKEFDKKMFEEFKNLSFEEKQQKMSENKRLSFKIVNDEFLLKK